MIPVWAEGASVARAVVHQTVPDHFILTLEALTALTPRTLFYWTIVGPFLTVDVSVRAAHA